MDTLVQAGLSNALAAAALALVLLPLARILRRPALTHAVCVLVLLKLLTPPLYRLPLNWLPPRTTAATAAEWATASHRPAVVSADDPSTFAITIDLPVPAEAAASPDDGAITPVAAVPPAAGAPGGFPWARALLGVWVVGSALYAFVVAVGLIRLRLLLRFARPSPPSVVEHVRSIATRLGLRACPSVWFVPGGTCPMLVAMCCRPRLLLPVRLWERLDDVQREAVLVHELAHYRRRDHWVRPVELLAAVLYWWHPAAWWARREMREAEEQCCDAWVVWSMPQAARKYMATLLEAMDLSCEARDVRDAPEPAAAVAMLASGMGQFHRLERRLVMIKRQKTPKCLSWRGLAATCGLALVLPLGPALGRAEPAEPPAVPEAPAAPADVTEPPAPPRAPAAPKPPRAPKAPKAPAAPAAPEALAPPAVDIAPTGIKPEQEEQSARVERAKPAPAAVLEQLEDQAAQLGVVLRELQDKDIGAWELQGKLQPEAARDDRAEIARLRDLIKQQMAELEATRHRLADVQNSLDAIAKRQVQPRAAVPGKGVVEAEPRAEKQAAHSLQLRLGQNRVIAVDGANGRIMGEFDLGNGDGKLVPGEIRVGDGSITLRLSNGRSIVLDLTTGKGLEARPTGGKSGGATPANPAAPGKPSPAAKPSAAAPATPDRAQGAIKVYAMDGRVYAVTPDTGKPIWSFQLDGDSAKSAASLTVEDGRVVVGGADGSLRILDLKTGRLLEQSRLGGKAADWAKPVPGFNTGVVGESDFKIDGQKASPGVRE